MILIGRIRRRGPCFASVSGLALGLSLILAFTYNALRNNILSYSNDEDRKPPQRRLSEGDGLTRGDKPIKILYTITSLAEYNTGSRATVKGSDRLQETLIPVVSEGVHSMLDLNFEVDVFLVSHYTLQPERRQLIRDALPGNVGLKFWEDAMPLGYDTGNYKENDQKSKIGERSLSLARQHRFVVRDHFLEYDVFVNFEDDMLIKGEHVQHYIQVSEEIERLKETAPDDLPGNPDGKAYGKSFHGPMTKGQLNRMIPGFIRVEVLLAGTKRGQNKVSPIPVDLEFEDRDGQHQNRTVDAAPCCHVSEERASPMRPSNPEPDQLMLWETEVQPLGVRQMPQDDGQEKPLLDWVGLLRGPTYDSETEANTIIGDYWAGSDGHFTGKAKRRPGGNARNLINNMGGWMATQQQIWNWHTQICPGGFLPPYAAPHYRYDGLDLRDVEWWSGGLQLATKRHACNMQRIVSLKPEGFSKHLIYHSANNKQSQLGMGRFTMAEDLLGQLNTVRKNAEAAMRKQQ